jgi:hypothetical protein
LPRAKRTISGLKRTKKAIDAKMNIPASRSLFFVILLKKNSLKCHKTTMTAVIIPSELVEKIIVIRIKAEKK